MNIVIRSVPQYPQKTVPVEISVETPNFRSIKTSVCYRKRIENVTTPLALIKALFVNEILELKNEIAETKHKISERGNIQTPNYKMEHLKF